MTYKKTPVTGMKCSQQSIERGSTIRIRNFAECMAKQSNGLYAIIWSWAGLLEPPLANKLLDMRRPIGIEKDGTKNESSPRGVRAQEILLD